MSRKTAYKARDTSPDFHEQWGEALEEAIDALEAVARVRAMQTSDTLLIFLLKSHRPQVYRETVRQEHTGADGGPVRFTFEIATVSSNDDSSP